MSIFIVQHQLDDESLEELSHKCDGNFYILPSSVHEVLVLSEKKAPCIKDLRDMVYEVNSTQVLPEEILSDNVYYYDKETKSISIAEHMA